MAHRSLACLLCIRYPHRPSIEGLMTATLVWLREDLRLADNPALQAAVERGGPVVFAFVLDEESPGIRPLGAASKWWLYHSLSSLTASIAELGSVLVLRRGAAETVLPQLVAELGAQLGVDAVFWNRRYGLAEREMDARLKSSLRADGVTVQSFQGSLLYEPWTVQTGSGKPYSVFTPFYRACLTRLTPRNDLPVPAELGVAFAAGLGDSPVDSAASAAVPGFTTPTLAAVPSDSLDDWHLLPTSPDWASGLRERWQPGEVGAHARLTEFLDTRLDDYQTGRDLPAQEATSELSPHLRWGEISPFQVWHRVDEARQQYPGGQSQGVQDQNGQRAEAATAFIRELIWREFNYHLLFHWPHLATQNFNPRFDAFPWWNTSDRESANEPSAKSSSEALAAWQQGRTGIPLVDAGMRELWHTGFMHNRVRMVVASFLTKNLLIDWREGEQWFWDTLVDADPANNPASWQWVAGCGADAAPYFRVFNPVLQAEKFDPHNEYIRQWVPEALDGSLGYTPIVDLKQSRADALAAYQSTAQSPPETPAQ